MGIYSGEDAIACLEAKQFRQVVNEAYFGRTPGINRCFNAFCDFRHKYLDSSFLRGIKSIDADHDKDLRLFISEMERQFGFYSFSFIISNSLQENMCTIPILIYSKQTDNPFRVKYRPSKSSIKDWAYQDKEGYHFNKDLKASCIIIANAQMLFSENYTDEEMFAVILHEVGHNFQSFLNNDMIVLGSVNAFTSTIVRILNIYLKLFNLDFVGMAKDLFEVLLTSQETHKWVSISYNDLTSDETSNNIYSYFNFIKGLLNVPTDIITALIMVPAAPLIGLVSGVVQFLSNLSVIGTITHAYGYMGEQMADNFPTYYGFGQDMVNTQVNKMPGAFGPLSQGVGKIPVIGHLYNFMLLPAQMMLSISDVHPADVVRAKSTINSMKTDVNDPQLSPKLRAELKKQIDESEALVNEYLKKANDISDPESLKVFYDKCIYTSANGGFKYKAYRSLFNLDKGVQRMSSQLKQESAGYNDIL